MTIEFDISESTAEYIRIQLTRATSDKEVQELREQLVSIEKELAKRHRELVKEHNTKHRR